MGLKKVLSFCLLVLFVASSNISKYSVSGTWEIEAVKVNDEWREVPSFVEMEISFLKDSVFFLKTKQKENLEITVGKWYEQKGKVFTQEPNKEFEEIQVLSQSEEELILLPPYKEMDSKSSMKFKKINKELKIDPKHMIGSWKIVDTNDTLTDYTNFIYTYKEDYTVLCDSSGVEYSKGKWRCFESVNYIMETLEDRDEPDYYEVHQLTEDKYISTINIYGDSYTYEMHKLK